MSRPLAVFLAALIVFVAAWFATFFLPSPFGVGLRWILPIMYIVAFVNSIHVVPKTRRLAAYFITGFEAQYLNEHDEALIDEWYREIGLRRSPDAIPEVRSDYWRSTFFGITYLQWPFFEVIEVISDQVRVEIESVDAVWTKEESPTVKDGTSIAQVQLRVDSELTLRLGADFGRLQSAFSDVDFSDPVEVAKGLKSKLEPVVKDAVRRAGREFVWIPQGSGITGHPLDISANMRQFEHAVRRELRRDPESIFVQAGLLAWVLTDTPDDEHSDDGPGVIALDVSLENVKPANSALEGAGDEAAIANAKAAALKRRAQGWRDAAETAGVSTEAVLGLQALENTDATLLLGGENMFQVLSSLGGKKPKPKKGPKGTP